MSPLTKTFAVLVTILSIILVALVVPFVANTKNLQEQLKTAQDQTQSAKAAANMAQQEVNAAQSQAKEQIQQYTAKINELTSTQTLLRQKLQDAQAKEGKAKSRAASLKASYTQLAVASKENSKLLTQVTNDLKTSQSKVVDQAKKLIDLDSHNQELEANLDSLNRQVRRFSEDLHSAQAQVTKYKKLIAKLPSKTQDQLANEQNGPLVSYAKTAIAGRITQIDNASGDLTLAQINLGSTDNVKPNMRFMIYRGKKFLGFLIIGKVNSHAAVGSVQSAQGKLQTGDRVLIPTQKG